jgi:hypothetical protein
VGVGQIEDSYKELAVDWVKADPSRFSQILVRFITPWKNGRMALLIVLSTR